MTSHVCYVRRMADVASRDLRNNTRALLDRVEAGESITITVDGRPVATLRARRSGGPGSWPATGSSATCSARRADPALLADTPRARARLHRRPPAPVTTGLADTTVFVAAETGRVARPLDRLPDRLAVSVITIGELRAGVLAAT